ncbi:MAG: hypothetical protein M0Z61_08120 [Nitrospiraceae bacterium]|nr:hypothetical protein [Nitrospiraceae bacterium]
MKEEIILRESIGLLQKEIATLEEKLSEYEKSLKRMDDMESELKAIKLFLGRRYPEFKKEYPEIIEKVHG